MKNTTKIIGILLVLLIASIFAMGELNEIDGKGRMEISVLCQHNLFSKYVTIWKEDPVMNIPATMFGDEKTLTVMLNPSGSYEGRFRPGTYGVYLYDGNGGHPELQLATVHAGYQTIVRFIGHAVTNNYEPKIVVPTLIPTPTPTLTPTPTPTQCIPITIWHEGYWKTERQWVCRSTYTEDAISCCDWQNVPVWRPGYWEQKYSCEG